MDEHPEHLREASETIEALRSQRHAELPQRERFVQDLILKIGRPRTLAVVVALIVAYVAANIVLRASGHGFDDATFSRLNLVSQLVSLVFVIAILSAQNTARTLEEERARLNLQLELINERKLTEILKAVAPQQTVRELGEPTNLHQAAEVLRQVEQQSSGPSEEPADGPRTSGGG